MDFKWERNGNQFSWFYHGKKIEKVYKYSLKSVIELSDKSGFAIVSSHLEFGYKNAFIINADGTIRFRLNIPSSVKDVICFHEIYYIHDDLTAIIVTRHKDVACIIDIESGLYKKIYDTR